MTSPSPLFIQSHRKPDDEVAKIRNRAVREFYERQNETIDEYGRVDQIIDSIGASIAPPVTTTPGDLESTPFLARPSSTSSTSLAKIQAVIVVSFAVNIILFLSKAFIAVSSGSLSILASTFDSLLDLLCGTIIWYANRLSRHNNPQLYPVGKSRMEPLGVVVFAAVTATSFTQILASSVARLVDPDAANEGTVALSSYELGLLVGNIIVKAALWAWCQSIKGSSAVKALGQDHGNDVVFNIAGMAFPVVGARLGLCWVDPLGAILLSLWVIHAWVGTLLENIRRLAGQTASPKTLRTLTYLAYRFSPAISAVETVRAYHFGDRLFAEVDIVMPQNMPLREAHDVGEALQDAIESMEDVERAFVHLDWEWKKGEHAMAL